jgi:hypothetical protein
MLGWERLTDEAKTDTAGTEYSVKMMQQQQQQHNNVGAAKITSSEAMKLLSS